jgi:SAM-dependent methyltransferase
MNWHKRYAQQADWTRELRSYIFEKTDFRHAQRVLEVGCGTGAVISEVQQGPAIYGLDIDHQALVECGQHAPQAMRVQGDALTLPYPDRSFDIVYSHFLLLWVGHPLQALHEMKRVTRQGGYVIAFAEPDYVHRIDRPGELVPLGTWQTDSLRRQGADPGLGSKLAGLFHEAGIAIRETGEIQYGDQQPSVEDWRIEWEVIEADLQGTVSLQDIQKMKMLDQQAHQQGTRILHVPTYFAWGTV